MRHEKLSEALNEISDRHIAEAADTKRRTPRSPWIGAVAAVLAVVILVAAVYRPAVSSPSADAPADSPAAAAPPEEAQPADVESVLNGISLLSSHFEASPDYPKMGKFDGYDWGPYYEGHRQQYTQPENYAAGTEDFFRSSMQQLLLSEDENQVYSPLNTYMALALLAESTGGDSRQQVLSLLGADTIDSLRTQAGHMWNAHYCDDGLSVSLLGNSLWLDEAYSFDSDTVNTLSDDYYASVYHGDLGSDGSNHILHRWINLLTGGLLQEQANNFNLQQDSMLALVSTIYYNTAWEQEFYEGNHTEDTFYAPAGDITTIYMNQTTQASYYWGEDFSAVPLRLMDGNKMWLILPDEGYTPAQIVESGHILDLVLEDAEACENQARPLIHLSLPKFDVACETDLIEPMKALGITDVFDGNAADFSALVTEKEQPYLAQMSHAARVMIDEHGVTGAAFTAMDAAAADAPPPDEEIYFTLNRPFLFVIESRGGVPVFCGIVNEP